MALGLDSTDTECLMNFINLLVQTKSLVEAKSFLDDFEKTEPNNNYIPLLKINLWWKMGENNGALELFKQCIDRDRKHALELFEINPDLKNVTEFVLLAD